MNRVERALRSRESLVCGVASGMAYTFGWSCFWTRLAWMLALFSNLGLGLLAYFAIAIVKPNWAKRY